MGAAVDDESPVLYVVERDFAVADTVMSRWPGGGGRGSFAGLADGRFLQHADIFPEAVFKSLFYNLAFGSVGRGQTGDKQVRVQFDEVVLGDGRRIGDVN